MIPLRHVSTFILMGFCGCLLVTSGCGDPAATTVSDNPPPVIRPIPVKVIAVSPGVIERVLRSHGRLRETARHQVVFFTEGIVDALPQASGATVQAGALLVQLAPLPGFADALATAEAQLQRAQRELKRRQGIAEQAPAAVSGSEMDRLRDAVEDADLALQSLRAQVGRRTITAPVAGVFTGCELTLGQRVTTGNLLGEIVVTGSLELPVALPETALESLATGQEVRVTALDGSETLGTILRLPELIDPQTGTGEVLVGITAPPPGWRPGGYATATCFLERVEADRVVPRTLVHHDRNRPFVWRVDEDAEHGLVLKKAWVILGTGDDDRVIVTDGLEAGDRIVTDAVGIREYLVVEIAAPDAAETVATDDADPQGGPGSPPAQSTDGKADGKTDGTTERKPEGRRGPRPEGDGTRKRRGKDAPE